jgi:uridine phosphorylase
LEEIHEPHLSRVAGLARVALVPRRLRPKTPLASDAILVGDPGRSLLLAQELLEQPKMSNHARGLWGYTGRTAAGGELTIQATGMGGPSAALVLADLVKLGVRRMVRVGTCVALAGQARCGELLLASDALVAGGSAAAFGLEAGTGVSPDPALLELLRSELAGDARPAVIASLDTLPPEGELPGEAIAADMQTVAVLARAAGLRAKAAAVLIVSEAGEERLADEELDSAAKRAGRAGANALSNLKVEG